MAGPGQSLSDTDPVFATGETSTLKATLANPANVIPVLSANLSRHSEPPPGSVEPSRDFFVKSILRDASGAYVIDYVLDGADGQVTVPLDNCPDGCRVTVNGRQFSLWNNTDDDDDMTTMEDGLGEYMYLASHRLLSSFEGGQRRRTVFVFGVRDGHLPVGTAVYTGELGGVQTWKTDDRDSGLRQNISGTMRIAANFDMRTLEGRIYRIRGSEPGSSTRTDWPTSSFTLTNGRIVNGQFTATLTGVDSDSTTPLDESVRGFMGQVLAEFYGPNAEEVGGVVTATREGTTDDRVLYGFIAGGPVDRFTGVNDSEVVSTGFDLDYAGDSTTLTPLESPTMEVTDEGYKLTYVVNGETQTVAFTESDFGTLASRPEWYSKETNGTGFRLWSLTRSFDRTTRRYFGAFRPEHFEINGWAITNFDAEDNVTSSRWGRIVYGNRTMDMPTAGTADYAGRVFIMEAPNDRAVRSSDPSYRYYRSELSLSADFTRSAVNGSFSLLQSRPGNSTSNDYVAASGALDFNATISGSGLSATDLSGSGDLAGYSVGNVRGAFYGPAAAEVAGVFDAVNDTQNKHLIGEFGGQKQ